MEQRRED